MSDLSATITGEYRSAFAPPAASPATRAAVIVPPAAGDAQEAFGIRNVFKLCSSETGGALTLGLETVPPGGGPPLHRHELEDELFITVGGAMEYCVDGAWHPAEPGTVVFLPRGVAHTFRNAGTAPAQQWVLTTPGGFDNFFRTCADVFADAAAAGTPPDMTRVLGAFAEYRIRLVH